MVIRKIWKPHPARQMASISGFLDLPTESRIGIHDNILEDGIIIITHGEKSKVSKQPLDFHQSSERPIGHVLHLTNKHIGSEVIHEIFAEREDAIQSIVPKETFEPSSFSHIDAFVSYLPAEKQETIIAKGIRVGMEFRFHHMCPRSNVSTISVS